VADGPGASEPSGAGASVTVGTHIGRYLVIDEIGAGGMGRVYRAYDPKLSREVAVKKLRVRGPGSTGGARMLREAKAMAQLSHPNVVPIYDVEIDDDDVAIAMEYVEGDTLREWLRRGPHEWREVIDAFVEAGRGLAAAHAQGIVHRDFKPANVLFGKDGRVRVMDFGLARSLDTTSRSSDGEGDVDPRASGSNVDLSAALTEQGTVVGTPAYMAPEQHIAGDADARTDQYAFCTALWEGLYGKPPFDGNDVTALVIAKRRAQPKPPPGSKVPSKVQAIVQRGLALAPEARWPDMNALLGALRRVGAPRRRWIAIAPVTLTGALAVWGVAMRDGPCERGDDEIATTWNADTRASLHDALLASNAAYATSTWDRVATVLDAYAIDWAVMYRDACEAAKVRHEESDEALDLRMSCLSARKDELAAVVALLGQVDQDTTQNAIELSAALTPLTRCADVTGLRERSPPPAEAEAVARVRAQLEQARLEQYAGRVAPALATAEAAARDAAALDYAPVRAEADFRLAATLGVLDRADEAQPLLERALQTALAERHNHTAAEVAVELTALLTGKRGRANESQWLARVALGLAIGDGTDERLIARAMLRNGYVLADRQLELEAEPYFSGAVLRLERALGTDHPDLVGPLLAWAGMLSALRHYEESDAACRRALAIAETSFGADHPMTARALQRLGWMHLGDARYIEAEAAFDRALAIAEVAFGPAHHSVWTALGSRAAALAEQGRYDAAIEDLEHSLLLMDKTMAADHPTRANALHNIARVRSLKGDHEGAAEVFAQVVAMRRRLDVKRELIAGLNGLGGELIALGRLTDAERVLVEATEIDEAIHADDGIRSGVPFVELGRIARLRGDLERARALFETAWAHDREAPVGERQASAAFELGRTLWELGDERRRGHELVETARETAKDDVGATNQRLRDEIDAWLAAHPGGLRVGD
jgi:eukaryotic-like serine/threonine-protein kinase